MTKSIIPKIAYIDHEFALSIEDFLVMWENYTGGQEGEPTQKDYDTFCRSFARDVFNQMFWDDIDKNIKLMESN
jgi:hypothetical protein